MPSLLPNPQRVTCMCRHKSWIRITTKFTAKPQIATQRAQLNLRHREPGGLHRLFVGVLRLDSSPPPLSAAAAARNAHLAAVAVCSLLCAGRSSL
jgi:hypothetical protein